MADNIIVDGVKFSADMKTLVSYPREKTDEIYRVPDGVEEIGEDAFENYELKTLVLPAGLVEIVQYAFFCPNLETLYVPVSLKRVCLKAFGNCGSLKQIYYEGTRGQWEKILNADSSLKFEKAEIVFEHTQKKGSLK